MSQQLLRNSTVKVAEALQAALMELANLRKGIVSAEFILLSLVEQKDSIILKTFDEMKLDTGEVRRSISDAVFAHARTLPPITPGAVANLKVAQEVVSMFEIADQIRKELGDAYISTGAVFLACFGVASTKKLLEGLGVDSDLAKDALEKLRGQAKIIEKDGESKVSILDEYCIDITALARKGELDPVIGREKAIKRVIQILSRRKKNNPILIGEPGVGKTVIVEGLANQIAAADVPEYLLNKRILSLEIGSLIAGAKMQGEFEQRLKAVKDEVIASAGEIILFIDELHTVVGAGRSGGGLDASNMLKPALAKGLLQTIGATTTKEYKQYIETDKALERRFQKVMIEQPTVEATVEILQGLKPKYENHHQIEYCDEALQAAAELSDKYITNRYLPDKAIDLLEEAGAVKRLKVVYKPPEIRKLDTKMHELLRKKTKSFNEQNFEQMAGYQMELMEIEEDLKLARDKFSDSMKGVDRLVRADDVAKIIARSTGIPAQKMLQGEAQRLIELEEVIGKKLIGQKHAVKSISDAIRRNRSGLRKANRPIASFLFLGPTGVGKTELAKAIAAEVLNDESKIIRLDMSEYSERHDVSKLIGSPPGYVGYGEGGQLTEKIKHQPYSVVLLDEFEKAHPDIYNIMLQVLDEGWLTDGEGNKVSFRNCIIIGTSNIGAHLLVDKKRPIGLGGSNKEETKEDERKMVLSETSKYLKPEFINRLDEIIVFDRLEKQDLEKIVKLQLADLAERLDKMSVKLNTTEDVEDLLVNAIVGSPYGARPLSRRIQADIENPVASLLIEKPGEIGEIIVSCKEGNIFIDSVPR